MSEKGGIAIIPIVPLLWGMAFLAMGFIFYPLLGIRGLVIIIVVGIVGMCIGLKVIRSANEKEKNPNDNHTG